MSNSGTPVLSFEKLYFVDNKIVDLDPSGVVVFVGPNNSGKTTALRELENYLLQRKFSYNNRLNSVFTDASMRLVTDEEFNKWLSGFVFSIPPDPILNPHIRKYRNWGGSFNADPQRLLDLYRSNSQLQELGTIIINNGQSAAFEGNTPNFYDDSGNTNAQFDELLLSTELKDSLRNLSIEAFDVPITISRVGSHSVLHFGELPELSDPPTKQQQEELRSTPRVSHQGQGVTSLVNIAQTMLLGSEPLIFIDEPEAHLHPPQAKLLGKYIGIRGQRSQVFLTTHSVELLIGLIDVPSTNVTIIRLDRKGQDAPTTSTLSNRDLFKAWKDPIVRYSRALSGLVHKGVVICESDADCLYYEVALDYFRGEAKQASHDLLFIHSGGNAGAKKIVPALMKLSVPTCVIVDFDTLRDWGKVKSLYEQLGGDASKVRALWEEMDNQLKSKGEKRRVIDVDKELDELLSAHPSDQIYSQGLNNELKSVLHFKSGWDEAKQHGLDALHGTPHQKATELIDELGKQGLVVCPFGELESFHRDVVGNPHGPEWSTKVIEGLMYTRLDQPKRDFISSIPSKLLHT